MINPEHCAKISKQIEQATNQPFDVINISPVSGGCINSTYILHGNTTNYFIKLNSAELITMFEAEFSGLAEIVSSNTVRAPSPVVFGKLADKAFLVMEMLQLRAGDSVSDKQLGHQLAELHKIKQPYFGWHQNNTIGSTKQINTQSTDWITFWNKNRLGFQLTLAECNGYGKKLFQSGEKLCHSLTQLFNNYSPQPALLHGDLWSGNAAVTTDNQPVIYDPACYYGDRESDIAMTTLFGGFGSNFYAAYNENYPLDTDYRVRKTLYNLYHILNHLNLFGEGYLQQAQNMIDSLLSEIK